MRIPSLILITVLVFSSEAVFSAEKKDSVLIHLKKAKEYYEGGDIQSTFLELNNAMEVLTKKVGRKMANVLPASTRQWTQKSKAEIHRLGKAGVVVMKDYVAKGKSAKVTLSFGSPLVPSIRSLSQNEFFKERRDVVKVKDVEVLFVPLPNGKGYEAYTTIGSWYLLTVRGEDCSKEDIVELISAVDYLSLLH